ncbi:MAG TPA: insulinase family protein [Crocinitomix sp.]|nr:insulinase family protein [Crocinitomix sp.]
MITYQTFTLKNGLKVIHHHDKTTPMVVVNTIYNVGARDETPHKTGFAHLFEHLMFGGSKHIKNYDTPLQLAGGECNAFTNNDITNYYNTLPAQNLETALWLESDRMLELAFTQKSLDVQRQVVIEEFKQRYLNQPYGDVWLKFRPLIYKQHPYQWPTIGKNIDHIANATMQNVKAFFYKHYGPQNATLVIGGNVEFDTVKNLVQKWYNDIPSREKYIRNIPAEPKQTEERRLTIEREVPNNALYMAFRMGNRLTPEHYAGDLLSDILSGGKSSRLYLELVKNNPMFSNLSTFLTAGWEDGLFIISGHLLPNITFKKAEQAIWNQIRKLIEQSIDKTELTKVKNKFETAKAFQEQNLLNRVMNIAMYDQMGQLDEINNERQKYDLISANDLINFAKKTFVKTNVSILTIKAK